MDNIPQMRKAILSVYKTPAWAAKVAIMPEAQVIAIYRRLQSKNAFKGDKS